MTDSATSLSSDPRFTRRGDAPDPAQTSDHSSEGGGLELDDEQADAVVDVESAGSRAEGAGDAEHPGLDDLDVQSDHEAATSVDASARVDESGDVGGTSRRQVTSGGDAASVDPGEDSESAGDAETGEEVADGTPKRGNRVRLLEREGEVAADFLERLLDIGDLDGDIEVDIDGDRAAVAIVDSEDGRVPRRLVGADGKVLEALQELTRLAVQAETGERSRLMLDVAGHRAARRVALVELAQTAIAEVKTTGAKKALDDMSAFERKIVHDEVAAAGLDSESEGVEPHRHIVVFPA